MHHIKRLKKEESMTSIDEEKAFKTSFSFMRETSVKKEGNSSWKREIWTAQNAGWTNAGN